MLGVNFEEPVHGGLVSVLCWGLSVMVGSKKGRRGLGGFGAGQDTGDGGMSGG
jgi:hypothetical protein